MEVKWMSRDKGSAYVMLWDEKPRDEGGRFGSPGRNIHAIECDVPVSVMANPPEPGTCVPVESFKPIEVTMKQEPKVTIRCETFATRLYSVYKGDRLVIGNITEELAILIHPNCVTLTAGCSCEIPPR